MGSGEGLGWYGEGLGWVQFWGRGMKRGGAHSMGGKRKVEVSAIFVE